MSTPDRTPEQPEPDTQQERKNPLENEGWGQAATDVESEEKVLQLPQGQREASDAPRRIGKKWWYMGSAIAVVALFVATVGLTLLVIENSSDEPDPLLSPENWTDNQMMSEAIIAAGGSCAQFDHSNDGSSTCVNDGTESNYLFGRGYENAKDVRIGVALADLSGGKSVAWDTNWAIACVSPGVGADPVADCQRLADAFGSPNAVREVTSGTITKDDLDKYDAGSSNSSGSSSNSGTGSTGSGPVTSFSDGTHRVGSDIQAGTYRNSGTTSCYWARLSGFSGTTDSILANANPDGQAIVTISDSDAAFQSQRCGTWQKIE